MLLCLAAAVACSREASWTVASFNVRYENRGDAERGNAWDTRYPYICQLIRYEKPDIFGAQEVLIDMLHDMCDSLPDYDYDNHLCQVCRLYLADTRKTLRL